MVDFYTGQKCDELELKFNSLFCVHGKHGKCKKTIYGSIGLKIRVYNKLGLYTKKLVFGVSDKAQLKPASSATETS